MLASIKTVIGSIVLFTGTLFVAPVNSEEMITFQGMIVEPSCELNVNSVHCFVSNGSIIDDVVAYFNVDHQGLLVGESKQLQDVVKKIDRIDIIRVDKSEYLVTANYF